MSTPDGHRVGEYQLEQNLKETTGGFPHVRPICTPEQIAADERRAAIDMMLDRFAIYDIPNVPWRNLFAQMYDCGCRMIAEEDK